MIYITRIIVFGILLTANVVIALTPLESVILGDLSDYYSEEKTDPMTFLFNVDPLKLDAKRSALGFLKRINLTRALINQAKNLKRTCDKTTQKLYFNTDWDFEQAKRGTSATMQFLGLDLSIRALAKYAKSEEYTEDEFRRFSERLVDESCSANMTIISKHQLKKYFLNKFIRDNHFMLPDFNSDPYFASTLEQINTPAKSTEQEFYFTTQIFKSFCSWGNDNKKMRFLGTFLADPILYSYLMNHLSGERVEWDSAYENIYLASDKNTTQVVCRDLICRRAKQNDFNRFFPRSIGSTGLRSDLERLYCNNFRHYDMEHRDEAPSIKKTLSAFTLDEQHLQISQFQALITGIPDLWVRAPNYNVVKLHSQSSINDYWNNWARNQFNKLDETILYEEPLTLEIGTRSLLFDKFNPVFAAGLDINQGEFDRAVEIKGKIKLQYKLTLNSKFANWIRKEWRVNKVKDAATLAELSKKMRDVIAPQVLELQKKFRLPPWRGDLSRLLAQEYLEQIGSYEGEFFQENNKVEIPLQLHLYYAPFALRYFHQLYMIEKNDGLFKDEMTPEQ